MKKIVFATLAGFTLMTGCYYDNEEELYPNSTTSTTSTTATTSTTSTTGGGVSYINDIKPLMANNCATSGCHVAGAQFPDLSTYAGVSGAKSIVRDRANSTSNPMPSSGLMSVANRNLLNSWIDAGALNN